MRRALIGLALLHLATQASAQIGLYNSEDGSASYCNNVEWSGSPQDVYILVTGEWKSARFSIPTDQSIISLDLQPLNGTTVSGNFTTGFALNFSGCTSDRRAVARLNVVAPFIPYCGFGLAPHPATGYVELVDCDGHAVAASWMPKVSAPGPYGYCENVGVSPPPRNPYPANGATSVPTSLDLSWVMDNPVGSCDLSFRLSTLSLGTTPAPPVFIRYIEGESQHVDGLQPATTYYWKVWVYNYGVTVESPVWTFTTVGPVAIESTTWGRVKALYKN